MTCLLPAVQAVAPDLLKRYESVLREQGHPGMAVITGGACGHCHTSLPSMVFRELRETEKIIQCDNCRRIYYFPEAQA